MKKKLETKFIASYFILNFLTFVFIFDDYGISWDEPFSRSNGFFSLEYIYSLLGFDFNYEFQNLYSDKKQTFKEYNDNFYGVVFDLPLAFIEHIFNVESSRNHYLLRHFFNHIIFLCSIYYFYLLLRKIYNFELSIIGTSFLIFTPRIFAESFYNSKDLIFLSLMIISTYYGFIYLKSKNILSLLKFAIFSGLATGSRLAGLMIPFFILFFSIINFQEKNKLDLFKNSVIYIISIIVCVIIFYPYLWQNPLLITDAINKISNFDWSGSVFYLGNYEIAKNMPWHYSIITIFATTPLVIVFLFLFGLLLNLTKFTNNFLNIDKNNTLLWKSDEEIINLLSLLIIFSTLFIIIELKSTIYGGWRQIYFIYPSIIIISIFSLNKIYIYFKKNNNILLLVLLFIFSQIYWIVKNHPYQYIYYNNLFSKKVNTNFELDYWGVSNYDILKKLTELKKRKIYKIYIYSISPYSNSLSLFDEKMSKKFLFTDDINSAEFIVTNHYYQSKNPIVEAKKLQNNFKLLSEINTNGIIINSIYEKK